MYGLSENTINKLIKIFEKKDRITKVIIFGSRAKGNYEDYSDIDLTVKGNDLDYRYINRTFGEIEDLILPYNTDLLNYNSIEEPALKEHINRIGKTIYEKL